MSKLDQIVKGAAPPGTSTSSVASAAPSISSTPDTQSTTLTKPDSNISSVVNDPLSNLPSSPPQIYLNLLILEASLRSQYMTLRARRRQNTFFLVFLAAWNLSFCWLLFLSPREDGRGLGGSVYWVIETGEKMGLMGGIVATILVWGTGQWERGVRWPRRFVATTNRGLRVINLKVIVVKKGWWREIKDLVSFFNPWSSFYYEGTKYHYIEPEGKSGKLLGHHGHGQTEVVREEDLAPGGDIVKLLLLPKPFSADFRENWDTYRTEYWEKENERRETLLVRLRAQEKQKNREIGGIVYWLGLSSFRRRPKIRESDVEMKHARNLSERDAKRLSTRRGDSHSRNASRSSTPGDLDERPPSRGTRRGSGTYDTKKRLRGSSTTGGSRTVKEGGRLATIPAGQTPLKRSESIDSEAVS